MDSLLAVVTIGLVQLLAVMSPGPSFILTAQLAASRSRSDGAMAALGMGVGTVMWAAAVMLGLQVLLQEFAWAYTVLRIVGGLFLLYVAWSIWRHAADPLDVHHAQGGQRSDVIRSFRLGLWTQLSNPKVAVFFGSIFVALLPRDVPGWMVASLLGIVFFNEFVWYALVATVFSSRGPRSIYLRFKLWIDRLAAIFLAALGVKLIIDTR